MGFLNSLTDFITGFTGTDFSKPEDRKEPWQKAPNAPPEPSTYEKAGGLFGGIARVAAPFITAAVTKPNKPHFPKAPDAVKNDPRVQELMGPYGGYDDAPSTKPLSPFQIGFGTAVNNLLYKPALEETPKAPKAPRTEPWGRPTVKPELYPPGAEETDVTPEDVAADEEQGTLTPQGAPEPAKFEASPLTIKRVKQYDALLESAAQTHGVESRLLKAIMSAESGGNPRAHSSAGALGLMQIMPDTARGLSDRRLSRQEILDPETNINLAAKLLKQLMDKYQGDYEKVMAAYNAGPKAVDSGRYKGFKETMAYVPKVRGYYNNY